MGPTLFTFASLCALAVSAVVAAPQTRIVGGDDAEPGQLPYQAALSIAGMPTCGASILSAKYALTAMQCVCSTNSDKPWPAQMFSIRAGSTDLYTGIVSITLEEITVNPNYSEFRTGIAILKLREALTFSDYIQPIALARERPPVNAIVEVSGWGRLSQSDENLYRKLQLNDAEVLSDEECARYLDKADDQVLCLSHARKNGICGGDFGGPAVYEGKLVGVAAYVIGECGSLLPDVFTSVASNYDWIVAQMKS